MAPKKDRKWCETTPIQPISASHLSLYPFGSPFFMINHFGSPQESFYSWSSALVVVNNHFLFFYLKFQELELIYKTYKEVKVEILFLWVNYNMIGLETYYISEREGLKRLFRRFNNRSKQTKKSLECQLTRDYLKSKLDGLLWWVP